MPKQHRGVFVTFEGTEGAGKSTLMKAVADVLIARRVTSKSIVITREPGGSRVAELIRNIILNEPMDPWTELFLYEASRAEHMAETVLPALREGKTVLCDRFTDSSLAYQSHARGLPWKEVSALNNTATQGVAPDLTVLIDVDPAEGLKRAKEQNRFEAEGVEFQTKVRQGFLKARRANPNKWITIKAYSASPEEMAYKVVLEIERRLGKRKIG